MKTYQLSFAQAQSYQHPAPDRTAKRMVGWDILFRVWNCRKAMARSVRMQQKRAPHRLDWIPLVSLSDGEGY